MAIDGFESSPDLKTVSRRRWLAVGLAALAVGPVALSACGAPASPTPAPAAPKPAVTTAPAKPTAAAATKPAEKSATQAPAKTTIKKWTVTTTTAGGTTALVTTVMTRQGFDKKYGIEVDAKPFTQADGEIALLTGKVDCGYFSPISSVRASKEGTDIVMFAPNIIQYVAWVVPAAATAQSWADMKGKKVATTQPITGTYQSTKLILAEVGITIDKDYQLVGAAPQAAAGFLEKGDVDAAALGEPVVSKLLASGKFKSLGNLNDVWKQKQGADMIMIAWSVLAKSWEQNREAALAFRNGVIEAHKYIQSNPNIVSEFKDGWELQNDAEVKMAQERAPKFFPLTWDQKVIDSIKYQMQRAIDLNLVESLPKDKIDKLIAS